MINYSLSERCSIVGDKTSPMRAYPKAQPLKVMELDELAQHIASHGSKYNRADINAVLIQAVDCLQEQLLAGMKVKLGDLGAFYTSISSEGAESLAAFNPAVHIKALKVIWEPSASFSDLLPKAEFNLVPTRDIVSRVLKAQKAGETVVDLTKPATDNTDQGDGTETGDSTEQGNGTGTGDSTEQGDGTGTGGNTNQGDGTGTEDNTDQGDDANDGGLG